MPKSDPLTNPKIEKILDQLKKLNIQESILVRDFLVERVRELKMKTLQLDNRIDDLKLSNRALFFLKRQGLYTVKDVINFKPSNLLQMPGLGEKTYNEICTVFTGKIKVPFRR